MATILENEAAWSTTAATNANVDTGVNWAEGQDAATVNNSSRGMMAARAKARQDQCGGLLAAGTNALSVTTSQVLSTAHLTDGLRLLVRAPNANTSGTVTFAPDGLTAANIKRADGSALAVGSITSGMALDLIYNSGSSEWRAVNIPPYPWAAWTPTVTAGSGTFTTVSGGGRYAKIGNTVVFNVTISISVNGTAASWVIFNLPTSSVSYAVFTGRSLTSGITLVGNASASADSVLLTTYINGYPGGSGTTLIVSGTYESVT